MRGKKQIAGVLIACMLSGGVYATQAVTARGEENVATQISEETNPVEAVSETSGETTTEIATSTVAETTADGTLETTQESEVVTTEPETTEPVEVPDYALIASRGCDAYAPADSLPAYRKAVELGYQGVRVDLRRCKPDAEGHARWVASDSDFLNETMGVNQKISTSTYEELLQYSYTAGNGIADYSVEELRIVSLEDIIALMQQCKEEQREIQWIFEIKIVTDPAYDTYLEEITTLLTESGMQDMASFASFDYSYLKKIKEIAPTFTIWFWNTKMDASTLHYAQLCQADGICVKSNTTSNQQELMQTALAQGYQLSVYNIADVMLVGTYYGMGIRNFVTASLEPAEVVPSEVKKKYELTELSCTLSQESYDYQGATTLPTVTVAHEGAALYEGLNYTLSYENTDKPGTASVTITGINNCSGEQMLTYDIVVAKVADFTVKSTKATYANLTWKQSLLASGYVIYHYNADTAAYEVVKTIEDATITSAKIKGLASGCKHKFKIQAYMILDEVQYDGALSAMVSGYTKPAKATLKSVTRYHNGDRLKIKWKKQICSGYQVKVATNQKMTKLVTNTTIAGKSKIKWKVKNLSPKKTYYVKVRAYLKVNGKKKYGTYSEVQTVQP